jgi:hypothetical protein
MNVRALRRFQDALPNDPLIVTASKTLAELDGWRYILLSAAAGLTITLPAAKGTGKQYWFAVKTLLSSNSYIIKCASSSDLFYGGVSINVDTANTGKWFVATGGPNSNANAGTLTLDGAHQGGGSIGDFVYLVDAATNVWMAEGELTGTATVTTPWST